MKTRILSILLTCAMLLSVMALFEISAADLSELKIERKVPNNTHGQKQMASLKGTPTVDGVIDDIWADAQIGKLEHVVLADSKDSTATDSNSVQFRTMWDEERIYVLIEVWDDEISPNFYDTTGNKNYYNNDSIYLYISETGHHTGYTEGKSHRFALPFYSEEIIKVEGKGSYGQTDAQYGITTPEMQRKSVYTENTAVIEFSFAIQHTTLVAHHNAEKNQESMVWSFDIQYQDVDASSTHAQNYLAKGTNPRTISTNWAADGADDQPRINKAKWGRIKLTTSYEMLKATPEIDGEAEGIWTDAQSVTLGNIVTYNTPNESRNPDAADSSTVEIKTVYDDEKVYFLFEIEDDDYIVYDNTVENWAIYKNDCIALFLAEQDYYTSTSSNYDTTNTYEIWIFPSDAGAYVRDGRGKAMAIEHGYNVSGNAEDGFTMTIEISIDLNVVENESGNYFYAEYQYNDANPDYPLTENNNRDIVRNWMSGDQGTTQNRVLGKMVMSETEATDPDAAVEIEPSLAGDYYVSDMDGNVLYLLNFNNGALTVVDKTEEDGADYSGEYTYNGTFDTGIKVYDASGAETGISITNMRGRYFFNTTPMGMGNLMSAGQPPVKPVMKLGDNAYNVTITNGWAEGVEVSFTAEKAGKYTLSAAGGEDNAEVSVISDYSSEMVDLPYEFVLDEGETVKFYISSTALLQSEDEINLVLSLEGENAETGDLGVMIAVVALVAVLGMGITAVTSKRVSVR